MNDAINVKRNETKQSTDRHHQLQCAIVRIMKSRRSIKYNALVDEVSKVYLCFTSYETLILS